MKPAPRLPKAVYAVNMVPVVAVAIIVYAANSMTKDTRAVLRSRRGEEGSLFSFIAVAVRPAVSEALDRTERCVLVLRVVWVVAVLCEERALAIDSGTTGPWAGEVGVAGCTEVVYGTSGSSSTSTTGGSGVARVGGLESWMGGDAFLNKEITADKPRQHKQLEMDGLSHLG